jgi:hypothetical protein
MFESLVCADATLVASDPVLATGADGEPPEGPTTEHIFCRWIEEPRRISARGWWLRHDTLTVRCSAQPPLGNVPARRVEPVVIRHTRENRCPAAGCSWCGGRGPIGRTAIECARLVLREL